MHVTAVSQARGHHFSKSVSLWIHLIAGLGVEGDAHAGSTVKHRSRVMKDPTQPNLRQVHLLHTELLTDLRARGFEIGPGQLGENILTEGIDLLELATGTCLHIGGSAVVRVTGLRNPCVQLDRFRKGLMAATLDRAPDGSLIRKAGIMGVVLASGDVRAGDPIVVEPPAGPHVALAPV
jgi:MOSC domain-containing protein YiiM